MNEETTNDKTKEDTISKDPPHSETDTKETNDDGSTQMQIDSNQSTDLSNFRYFDYYGTFLSGIFQSRQIF